jgi:hypothetical protein
LLIICTAGSILLLWIICAAGSILLHVVDYLYCWLLSADADYLYCWLLSAIYCGFSVLLAPLWNCWVIFSPGSCPCGLQGKVFTQRILLNKCKMSSS